MTSMERTIYCHVKRSYTTKELIEAHTPTKEERHFIGFLRVFPNSETLPRMS